MIITNFLLGMGAFFKTLARLFNLNISVTYAYYGETAGSPYVSVLSAEAGVLEVKAGLIPLGTEVTLVARKVIGVASVELQANLHVANINQETGTEGIGSPPVETDVIYESATILINSPGIEIGYTYEIDLVIGGEVVDTASVTLPG